jgi:hypothetical protein
MLIKIEQVIQNLKGRDRPAIHKVTQIVRQHSILQSASHMKKVAKHFVTFTQSLARIQENGLSTGN